MKKNTPKVYVGTYAKYNNGNLSGKWLDLTDYKTHADFVSACKALHKDENDPELMIQDAENMPEGLSIMEWVTEQDFNDILSAYNEEQAEQSSTNCQIINYSEKAIAVVGETIPFKEEFKKLGGKFNFRLSCGCGWIFPKTKMAEVSALIGGDTISIQENQGYDYKGTLNKLIKEVKQGKWNDKRVDDITRYYIGAVEMLGGYYLIPKNSIENKFCFADEGESYEYYKKLMADEELLKKYFFSENIAQARRNIDITLKNDVYYFFRPKYSDYRINLEYCTYYQQPSNNSLPLPQEEKEKIQKATEWQVEQFSRRLNTYLKKYGVSKLHIWTYWRDA